jgi:hypothetical protein
MIVLLLVFLTVFHYLVLLFSCGFIDYLLDKEQEKKDESQK